MRGPDVGRLVSLAKMLGIDERLTPGRRAALAAGLGVTAAAVQLAVFWRALPPRGDQEGGQETAAPEAQAS